MLTLVNTNNYFGQHEFIITNSDLAADAEKIQSARWFKKPKVEVRSDRIVVFCFTNYDKATMERLFGNG